MRIGLSHISIVVPDIRAAIRALRDTYGLDSGEIRENRDQGVRLCYVDLGNGRIELIEPLTADSAVARFLAKHPGGGLHHVCLGVADVGAFTSRLKEKGVRILGGGMKTFNTDGDEIAFVHPADFFGALLELEPRHLEPLQSK